MSWPYPRPGMVIRYGYLWLHEHDQGRHLGGAVQAVRSGRAAQRWRQAGRDGAIFFSPSAHEAEAYASGEGARIYRVKVNPGRTKVFDPRELIDDDEFVAARQDNIGFNMQKPGNAQEDPARFAALFDEGVAPVRADKAEDARIKQELRALQ